MSAWAWWLAGALAAARVMYPRVLERRHNRRFSRHADGVTVGAEPIDLPRGDAPAVLVLHGGGDTPQSVRELANYLHARGYAVRAPLLEGHGRSLQQMREFKADRWRAQARAEFSALSSAHDWVGVVGQSVGGALALELAASSMNARALVLLAPWVAMPEKLLLLARTSRLWEPVLPYLPSFGGKSIHDPVARSRALTHGIVTPAQLRALAALARTADEALPGVKAPTLTVQSSEDRRISRASAQRAFDRLGASDKRIEWTSGSGHVISVDHGKERVYMLAADWLDAHRAR